MSGGPRRSKPPHGADRQLRLVGTVSESTRSSTGEQRSSFRVAGLFAGVGGLELGFDRAGHTTNLLCEFEPGARAVLDARFPSVPKHGDICTLEKLPRDTDVVTAGFPCQDLSQAGLTRGIGGDRSGLVAQVFRLLEGRRVPWVVLENVPFMLQLSRGRALDVIVAALENLGYRWAYRVVDTRAFGLPQRRERVFLVASMESDPRDVLFVDEAKPVQATASPETAFGFYWTEGVRGLGAAVDSIPTLKGGSTIGIPSPPAIWMPDGSVVKPDLRDAERLQGFDVDWTEPAERLKDRRRSHRWKLVGNAVTVDVAQWLGSRLAKPGRFQETRATPVVPGRAWPRVAWNVGSGRFTMELSSWPVAKKGKPITRFLKYRPEPLSIKATAGFLSRAESSSLRFPEGFLVAIASHLKRMQANVAAA